MRNSVILIPAYRPSVLLIDILTQLKQSGFHKIIVVDDGSGTAYREIFQQVRSLGCTVATHSQNKGKGQALKTGFKIARDTFNLSEGIVTADADNQHQVCDIIKVSEALKEYPDSLIMGTRSFNTGSVPFKSLWGNRVTSFVFQASTGVACKDTQTGLRGLPESMIDIALRVHGSRYEYEYNFLLEAAEHYKIVAVPIQTIYIDDNKGSHFRPFRDSLLIYQRPIKFIASSLIGFLSDVALFYLISLMLSFSATENIIIATATARVLSGIINYGINKKAVFGMDSNVIKSFARYAILFSVIMAASAVGTAGLSMIITSSVVAKIIVDVILFVFSYTLQKNWVFAKKISVPKASKIWKSCTALILAFYVGFTLLNRFVMPQNVVVMDDDVYTNEQISSAQDDNQHADNSLIDETTQDEQSQSETEQEITEPIITPTSYTDEYIQVTIDTIREFNTDIYIAEIIIEDSSYLKTGLAENSFGANVKEKTSEIALENGAILAINGDYYGFRDDGYVMRNGYLYRETMTQGGNEDLVIYSDGSMEIINEEDITAQELERDGAVQIFSFGPGLISQGEILVNEDSQVEREDPSNPRTAIAMIEENHYIFMVADGRTNQSEGLSLEEMAIVLSSYDCEVAYNLDGGGSATMVFMGELVNNPTTNGRDIKERSVSDIVYIG